MVMFEGLKLVYYTISEVSEKWSFTSSEAGGSACIIIPSDVYTAQIQLNILNHFKKFVDHLGHSILNLVELGNSRHEGRGGH